MVLAIQLVQMFFNIYLVILFIRIVGSWFPNFAHHPVMRYVGALVDPYLNLFRTLIPPIGGVLDLSPILAYVGLQIIEKIITKLMVQLA